MLGIEKQDAILSDDADDHDHAHERRYVKSRASDKELEEPAKSGEQCRSENGGGRRERAEFEQQHHEQQYEREKQHHHQIVKRFLLLLVQATVLDADGRWQMQVVDSLLNGSNAAAKVRSFQARGDLNKTLKIFAPNFRLPRLRDDRGQRT